MPVGVSISKAITLVSAHSRHPRIVNQPLDCSYWISILTCRSAPRHHIFYRSPALLVNQC